MNRVGGCAQGQMSQGGCEFPRNFRIRKDLVCPDCSDEFHEDELFFVRLVSDYLPGEF